MHDTNGCPIAEDYQQLMSLLAFVHIHTQLLFFLTGPTLNSLVNFDP